MYLLSKSPTKAAQCLEFRLCIYTMRKKSNKVKEKFKECSPLSFGFFPVQFVEALQTKRDSFCSLNSLKISPHPHAQFSEPRCPVRTILCHGWVKLNYVLSATANKNVSVHFCNQ